jgi:N,N'-diacetyllegionaminate synthase
MNGNIRIGERWVGEDQPLFIMAECGVTCNYDMDIAKGLIDVVAESGADAVKFIFWFPDEIMSDRSIEYTYDTLSGPKTVNMYEMLSKLRFSLAQWKEIKAYADRKGVILFSTVNSPSGIAYAEELRLPAYKLSSWDYNYSDLFTKIGSLGKPIVLDTGPVYSLDVAKALGWIREKGNDQVVLMHCYHTSDPGEMNMRSIPHMKKAFRTMVGFSSPDTEDTMDIVSVSLGAVMVEKRLTLSRTLPGHHHVLSKEPGEFAKYVKLIRGVQRSLGEYDLRPSPGDLAARKKWFRHLAATRDIPAGTRIEREMIEAKRGETGVSPEYAQFFIGRTTRRAIKKDESITWEDL